MAAWKLVEGEMQSLLRDATLELEREEAVVASGDHVDRDRWPRLEFAGLAEGDVGLGAVPRFSLFHDLAWEVVEEVGGEIEARGVATAVRGGDARLLPAGVGPPLPRRLPGRGDHGVDEDQRPHPSPRTHERRGEAAERLRDEDRLARP